MRLRPEQVERMLAQGARLGPGVKLLGDDPAPTISEKQFQAAVVREAKRLGWLCYHTYDSRKSQAGFPDLVMLRAGSLVVAELKVGDNQPSAAQRTWLECFAAAGVEVHLWRPENWPEIMERLK